jgi:hypothetical protein
MTVAPVTASAEQGGLRARGSALSAWFGATDTYGLIAGSGIGL